MAKKAKRKQRKSAPTKKRYTFKSVINGVEYSVKVTPKQHVKLRKQAKQIDELTRQFRSLRNGFSSISEKEKAKAEKEIKKLENKASKLKHSVIKEIKKKSHTLSTENKFGVKTTLTIDKKRSNSKPKQDVEYYIVFKVVGEIEGNEFQYDFVDGGIYTAFEIGKKGDTSFYDIIERRFSKQVANAAEIISVRTETKTRKLKK